MKSEFIYAGTMMSQHNSIKQEDIAPENSYDDHIDIKIEDIPMCLEIRHDLIHESEANYSCT